MSLSFPRRPYRLLLNRHHGTPGLVTLPEAGFRRAQEEIASWPGYAATPLHKLPDVATAARVAAVHYKDEGGRFGLGSFKALGGAYAVMRLLQVELAKRDIAPAATAAELAEGKYKEAAQKITVTCATDGNHGRSVAWGAQRFGARCVIFVHEHVSQGRRDAIAAYGATIRVVPGNYDDSVREAQRTAEKEGWFVVSDTSYPGYTEVPRDVMQGYRVMAEEAAEALPAPPTHVFVQGGVGGVAAAVSAQMRARYPGQVPKLVVVEPEAAACLLASAEAGAPTAIEGELDTLMAGLACGEPSLLAWQELERAAFAFMAVPDAAAVDAMKLLAARSPKVVAGESAVAGLAGLLLAAREGFGRAALGLEEDSRVLLFGTEGATDPELYAKLVGEKPPASSN
ncbi:diaminopropionate ammonia-lyase [Siccirubricoccus sp. KC 17139]|uniref:Diaminopropionate ammonia-lyase n=1 Tax=Siccirubricoccus soli TaxID=2899147 RepID=A0ABT1D0V0_9PROT|nr:diaminopropionate ammonia-lyase [Siccirubricoccus soli]MCO6414925.1 diaminopropionate ammonia-lyase [Siccirubricoccus soli]MCP2681055.1 diaminopropionate ammonia-lyase [Siccirubricoccus soli]